MRTTLTSFDGYPRADIDIAQIRTTRARIIHLRNDHKAVMDRIEKALHSHFAESEKAAVEEEAEERKKIGITTHGTNGANASINGTGNGNGNAVGVGVGVTLQPAFAFVNTITPSSPASTAGLKPGDRIIAFGDANWRNHEKLAKVAQIVGRSEGRRIEVVVAREQQGVLTLGLVPRRDWGGRGTLGCHLKEV